MKHISDYTPVVQATLLSQYKRAGRLLGIVEAGCSQANNVEEAMFEIRDGFWIRNAVGVQLDILGRIYKVPRGSLSDDNYRIQLQFQAASLVNGNPEELLTFLSFVTGVGDLEYFPEYPAGFAITTDETSVNRALLESLAPAGVRVDYANPMLDALGNPMLTALNTKMYALL